MLASVLSYAHTLLKQAVGPGETVIDGTVGNGHDTIFLAELVGPTGHVLGFDIQEVALEKTQQQLVLTGLTRQVNLLHDSHDHINKHVKDDQPIAGAIFNLGYLPGGDKTITTQPETSLSAIRQAVVHCRRGGIVVVVLYPGHPTGKLEAEKIMNYAASLDQHTFNVLQYRFINQVHEPPYMVVIETK